MPRGVRLSPAEINRRKAIIRESIANGETVDDVVKTLGLDRSGIYTFARLHELGNWRKNTPKKAPKRFALPVGMISLRNSLTPDQLRHLEAKALACECETMSEYALEMMRDAIDESMEEEKG